MNQSLIVESVLKYLNDESIDTTAKDENLVDQELLEIVENAFKTNSNYHIIFSIYAFLSFQLYNSDYSIEKIFPTINKSFEKFGLSSISIKYEKKKLEYVINENGYGSLKLKQSVKLIKRLSEMFSWAELEVNDAFFDDLSEQIKLCPQLNQKTLQQFTSKKYEEYLYKLLFYMIRLLQEKNYSKFFKMTGLFLVTATAFYGNETFSIEAMFQFFDIVEKYSKIEKIPIGSVLATLKKLYISVFFHYKNLIKNSKNLEKLEISLSIENAKLVATKLAIIDEKFLDALQSTYKVDGSLWFSPLTRKNEWMVGEKESEMNKKIEDFLSGENEKVFEYDFFDSHPMKLMVMTRTLYNITRKSFIEDKNWINNSDIEEIIRSSEEFIHFIMKSDSSALIDQRLLSFISAKNGVKMKYNLYNNKWSHSSLIETHISELYHIIDRKHYLIDAATCGKIIEEICKIQDYLNLNNIYLSLEEEYLNQMKNLEITAAIRSLILCNNFSIDMNVIDPYNVRHKEKNRLDYYNIRQTRVAYYYELGNHFLSSMKFLGPCVVWNSRAENNVKKSIDFVNSYWNYFNKYYGLNQEEISTIRNTNSVEHV